MSKIEEFVSILRGQVGKGIYVWGGNGQDLCTMKDAEAWIRSKETSDANAERAIKLYRARVAAGVNPIRAFDCSGLIYWTLKQMGLQKTDVSSRGLYGLCVPIAASELRAGDLVFRWTDLDADGFEVSEIYHVGAMSESAKAVECIGRDSGVVEQKCSTKWKAWGRPKWFVSEDASAPPEDPSVYWRDLYVATPYMRGADVLFVQTSLVAAGYDVGKSGCDGIYGDDTEDAVARFQKSCGIPASGVVDLPTWSAILTTDSERVLMGDADGDGKLTAADAAIILRSIVGNATELSLLQGDANSDGKITAADASYILRCVVGLATPVRKESK